ncbi:FGGY-family carbohydrate kinase [Micrococcaceae bacterium Sec5.8]
MPLLDGAAALPAGRPQVNADDPAFSVPGNMPERIRAAARETGAVVPDEPEAVVCCILDSLAAGYARTISEAERLTGRRRRRRAGRSHCPWERAGSGPCRWCCPGRTG